MRLRRFGKSGLQVSEIGLGANFIETAQGYGDGRSESVIARIRKEWKGELE